MVPALPTEEVVVISVAKRRLVKRLLRTGRSTDAVARVTGISVRSVRRIAGEPPLASSDRTERRRRRVGRPSAIRTFESEIARILERHPGISSAAVLERLRALGYDGGRSAGYDAIRRSRLRTRPVLVSSDVDSWA